MTVITAWRLSRKSGSVGIYECRITYFMMQLNFIVFNLLRKFSILTEILIIFAPMDKSKIQYAINSAYSLISGEYESLCDDDLREEYDEVLHLLTEAMDELNK